MDNKKINLNDIFKKDGFLSKNFENYEPRPSQFEMAKLVEKTIKNKGLAAIEGETGVGKSFGYLIPILVNGEQAIISTSNKALQDQLNLKDLPSLNNILPFEVKWIVLKGKSNYFCFEHFDSALKELKKLGMSDYELQKMSDWASDNNHNGDMDFYPEKLDKKIRDLVTCDSETVHKKSSDKICYAQVVRSKAKEAHIVLTNHSLLAIDLSVRLKSDHKVSILPDHRVIVLDEAHAFEQYASLAFSSEIRQATLKHLLNWYEVSQVTTNAERAKLLSSFKSVENRYLPPKNGNYYESVTHDSFAGFQFITEFLAIIKGRVVNKLTKGGLDSYGATRIHRISSECNNLRRKLIELSETDEDILKWVEAYEYKGQVVTTFKSVPLNISDMLSSVLYPNKTVIATSATITTARKFDFFIEQMGMPVSETETLIANSPFNFKDNSLTYVIGNGEDKISVLNKLLTHSKGRAFVLFTSYRDMNFVYNLVDVPYPKLKQEGRINRRELLESFRQTDNAILFGTKSFWEGVDVRGENLSMVVIDKLPFPNPYEPIVKAKIDRIEQKHGKRTGFYKYSIPNACITFKQGIGRLIRSTKDRGVIAILDNRMNGSSYASAFVKSLPKNIYITQKTEAVKEFFGKCS